ncbi:MAG: prepilin peptidase [Parasporobacterium sp.]|nr:prepilin peptidase [Parasporobacterium sp.]
MNEILIYARQIIILLFLAYEAFEDIRTGTVNTGAIALCGAAGLIINIITGEPGTYSMLTGTILGGLMVLISFLSREAVGMGDALIMVSLGLTLGYEKAVILTLAAFIMAALCSVCLMVKGYRKKKESIPFAPFLMGGYLLVLGVCR